MSVPDLQAIARRIDRYRRQSVASSATSRSAELQVGWISGNPASTETAFASTCPNRVNWNAPEGPIDEAAVDEAIAAAKSLGLSRVYFWIAPWAVDEHAAAALQRAGAVEVPWVKYPLLARASDAPLASASTTLTVRAIARSELQAVLAEIRSWYSESGVAGAARAVESRGGEAFAAFDGERPVAFAILFPDSEFAYLGFAGTQPEYRKRGAQSALIRARVVCAAEQGTPWCIAETNTVLESSLRNLARQGFAPVIVWRVFGWPAQG